MNKPGSRPIKLTRSVCVIEVVRSVKSPCDFWEVVISLPGRPGTFSRAWETPQGRMSQSQMEDFISWLQVTCQNAVLVSGGIQLELLLTEQEQDATPPPGD